MKNNFKYSFLIAPLSLVVLLFGAQKVLAAPSVTSTETNANVEQVVEVKAVRILTVGSAIASSTAGNNPARITIGSCVVSFATTTSEHAYIGGADITADEVDCTDNAATILLATTTNDTALSVALLAQELRGLKNVSDTNHGALTVASTSNDVSFTTTNTETTATNINIATSSGNAISNSIVLVNAGTVTSVVPVTAEAQVTTFTPSGPYDGNYTFTITIGGTDYSYVQGMNGSTKQVVDNLTIALAANTDITCTDDDAVITCTADVPGTSFTASASVTEVAATIHAVTGSRSGGGGGGSRVAATAAPTITVTTIGGLTADQVSSIRAQINNLLALIQKLQQKLLRMQGR